jgi:4-hydroxy-3-methylbut-2-enyl diphosphate reductase
MAIKALAWMVKIFDPPIYCYHEIVHNATVVDRFRAAGVQFVDDPSEVPAGAPLMLSAHGSAPSVATEAASRGVVVLDAVCPLVTKVHHEVKTRAKRGYSVIYIGHKGHDEANGTIAVAPEAVHLIETTADLDRLPDLPGPIALLTQTTLSVRDWRGMRAAAEERYPDLWAPSRSDLCYATTNRQAALEAVARQCDAVVVIGSSNSSNTIALTRIATDSGCQRVVRVDGPDDLPSDLTGIVGLTAGASAPEDLVQSVLERLHPSDGVELIATEQEDEYFPLPRSLREVLKAMSAALSLTTLAPVHSPSAGAGLTTGNDRTTSASQVLADLTADI